MEVDDESFVPHCKAKQVFFFALGRISHFFQKSVGLSLIDFSPDEEKNGRVEENFVHFSFEFFDVGERAQKIVLLLHQLDAADAGLEPAEVVVKDQPHLVEGNHALCDDGVHDCSLQLMVSDDGKARDDPSDHGKVEVEVEASNHAIHPGIVGLKKLRKDFDFLNKVGGVLVEDFSD